MIQHKEQRVGIFVDVQNLYYSAKSVYGRKINFKNILKTAVANRNLVRAIAYVITTEERDKQHFYEGLEKMGYEIRAKPMQIFTGGAKKGDWDVGIAMDVMKLASKLDVIVLVSGDGDFKDLLEHCQALGCQTEVIAFGKSCSSKLREVAHNLVDMDKNQKQYLLGAMPSSGPARRKPIDEKIVPIELQGEKRMVRKPPIRAPQRRPPIPRRSSPPHRGTPRPRPSEPREPTLTDIFED